LPGLPVIEEQVQGWQLPVRYLHARPPAVLAWMPTLMHPVQTPRWRLSEQVMETMSVLKMRQVTLAS
jgi:hypothetical protein